MDPDAADAVAGTADGAAAALVEVVPAEVMPHPATQMDTAAQANKAGHLYLCMCHPRVLPA